MTELKKGCNQGYIYIIKAGKYDIYKIGITTLPIEKRLSTLQTGNHLELSLLRLYRVKEYRYLETILKASFIQYHIRGEWYTCPLSEIIKNFNELEKRYDLVLERKYDHE